ncbi:MAG: hypothetical protein WA364_23830 [Candidatus Nitrosopolaris sp.]
MIVEVMTNKIANDIIRHQKKFWMSSLYEVFCRCTRYFVLLYPGDDPNVEKEAFQTGLSIAKLLTSYWNSQQNPGKAYLFKRRVHHDEIGALLGLSNLFKKHNLFRQEFYQV